MPLQFTVPQFIDVEDKIFGPISVRQFIILLVGSISMVIVYRLFGSINFFLTVAVEVVLFIGMLLLAFVKIHGTPLHQFMLHFLQAKMQPQLRVWSPEEPKGREVKEAPPPPASATKGPLTASRLTELSLLIDTGGAFKGSGDENVRSNPYPSQRAPRR
jgi:hypothetical protein